MGRYYFHFDYLDAYHFEKTEQNTETIVRVMDTYSNITFTHMLGGDLTQLSLGEVCILL